MSKYWQKMFFLLVMGFSLCAVQACSSDDDDDEAMEEAMADPSNNTTDIAVTGLVEDCGYTTAHINGYVNLDKLFPGSEGQINWGVIGAVGIEIGVQVVPPSSESPTLRRTTNVSSDNRKFSVEVDGLSINTEYKYCTFVKYGTMYHYGEYATFTTKDIAIKSGAVDLGLSVKWAACNVGANSPQEYGGYYAWGETEEKDDYSWDTYKWYKIWDKWGPFKNYGAVSKYSHYSTVESEKENLDYKMTLEASDDVARVKLGGNWRMPTKGEMQELCDKCTWQRTAYDGINGHIVIGPNGNSIFLPAAGYRYGTGFSYCGSDCYYWTAALGDFLSNNEAYTLRRTLEDRYCGLTVRPVMKK